MFLGEPMWGFSANVSR